MTPNLRSAVHLSQKLRIRIVIELDYIEQFNPFEIIISRFVINASVHAFCSKSIIL